MLGIAVLWVNAIVFISYGIACLLSPELPAGYAGLTISNGDAYVEMGAMYGGLQTGFGLFILLCALRPAMRRNGLLLLAMVIGSLALARLYTSYDADWLVGGYTWGAMAHEFCVAILASVALKRR